MDGRVIPAASTTQMKRPPRDRFHLLDTRNLEEREESHHDTSSELADFSVVAIRALLACSFSNLIPGL